MNLNSLNIDVSWTLFLDRDGVINRRLPDDYVKTPDEFDFTDGTLEAIADFTKLFGHIFVITNQQGVGKGLMSPAKLDEIHQYMTSCISKAGGKIDKVYYCPDLSQSGSFMRKPNIGMGLRAKKEFPEIQFNKSIMVGDTDSDMKFGKRLGMKTIFISDDLSEIRKFSKLIHFAFPNLLELSKAIKL